MKKLVTLMLVFLSGAANAAPITYEVNRQLPTISVTSPMSVTGTITTDGTIGAVGAGNIIEFELLLDNGNGSQSQLFSSNPYVAVSGAGAFSATSTELTFGVYSSEDWLATRLVFSSSLYGTIWELSGTTHELANLGPCPTWPCEGEKFYQQPEVIGSVVPIPAAVWLLGSSLGLLGWMKRRG